MANSALGAALTIPQSALDAIEQADKKLKDIQDTAKNTAASVTKSFDNMAIGTKPFLDALDQVINKLNIVGTSATNASGGLNNIGASAGTMSGNITQASVNVQNMVAQLSKMNGSGTSGIMQAVLAFQRLQEATKGASGMNIAELKQEIGAIDSMLKDVDYNLTKTDQDALIKRKKMLQDELKYQQQMYEERAVAFQKALDKMVSAQDAYDKKQQKNKISTAAQATEKEIEQLEAKFKDMKAPDFSKTYDNIQNLKVELKSVREEFSATLKKIIQQDDFKAGKIKSAPALKKGEYEEMQHNLGILGDKERSLQAEIDALTLKIKKENSAWREQRQALAENIEMLKNLKSYKSDSSSLDNQRSKNTLSEMRQYYTKLEKTSKKAAQKAAQEEETLTRKIENEAKRRKEIWAKTTPTYGQQYHNERQSMYESLFSVKNTTSGTALVNSANARTLREQVAAIKELKEARLNLDTTDKNYKQKLDAINAALAEHNKKLKEAGINTKQLGEQTSYMAGYLSRWAQRMAFAFSIGSIKNFVEQLADVRGQFELSQRSLEAILQNKPKADEIFNKTVELAVKSPFRIKDLVDYTRQLSAYQIESNKLYDTTKRLADVSAGLGVDMGRLILAYGQVNAAAYLRGSEVRQFTEAGVNMYGELQQYFKEVKGEAYTTAQIVDMISKRKVTFEDVEAIFQRMTDKGGTFYNMQEIQAETLQGKISNLKDAFDVMLNDIGKSNEGLLKGTISSATDLLNHWEAIVNVAKALLSIVVAIKINSMFMQSSLGKAIALDAAMVGRWQAFKNLIMSMPTAFGKMKAAISSIAGSLKAALGGVALYAVIQTIMNYRDALQQFDETVRKARENTIDTLGRISELSAKYKELSNSAKTANNTQNNNEDSKVIDEKRKALNKLIEQAKKDGLEIKINITELDEKQLDKEFESLKKRYTDFVFELEAIKERAAQSNKKGWWWGLSGIKEGLDEYKSATIDIVSQTNKIEKAMALANINYKDANAQTQKYFDTLRKGRIDGEADIDYLKRMNDAWKGLEAYYSRNSMLLPKWLTDGQKYIKDVADSFDDLDSAIKQTQDNFKDVFIGKGGVEEFKKKYQKDPIKLRAEINTYASENDLSGTQKQLLMWIATNRYGIKFPAEVDGSNAEPTIKTIIEDLQEYADQNKIKISVEVKDPKNLNDTISGYQKSAKDWQETIDNIKRSSKNYFIGAYLDIGNKESWNGQNVDSRTVFSKEAALKYAEEQKKAALYWNQFLGGKDPFAQKGGRSNSNKTQRDILQERISLLKDMNAKYNELIKVESKEQALTDTRKYFKEAAQNVGWNANDILPDDASVIKRIREIGAKAEDVGKRGGYFRIAADIEFKIKDKEYTQLKDEVSQNIEDAFSGLELFKKLKSEGLSEGLIKSMFGDIATSFADVNKKIDEEFNKYTTKAYETKYGKDKSKWSAETLAQYKKDMANTASVMQQSGEEVSKDYADKQKKLAEKIKSSNINTFTELTKAYKTQLTEQLQLDKWYAEEKIKIQENVADPKLQKEYLDNLTKQYNQKTSENEWKSFQNSDMYIAIFENLDQASSRVLTAMKQKLESLRTSLKDLSPEQLKQIVKQIESIDEKLVERNPIDGLGNNFSQYISFATKRKQLEEDYAESLKKETQLKTSKKYQGDKVNTLEAEYNKTVEIYGANSKQAQQAKLKLQIAQAELDVILKQLVAQGKITEKQAKQIRNGQQLEKSLQDRLHSIGQGFSEVSGTISETFEMLNDWGLNINMSDEVQEVVGGLDKIGSSLDSIDLNRPFSVIKGTIGVIGGIGKTLGGIFGWGTKDKRLQREIERHQKAIDKLKEAYDDLKEAMDNAYDIAKLSKYSDEMIKNLELQNQNLQSMIAAEKDKKDTDDSKIEEWQKQIEANNKAIKEAEETLTEQLGGFGTKANYKSAAEAFADVWVDAFNEGSDALEALNDKFDEYFNNLLKKQLMARAAARFIQPILDAVDAAVSKGSEGGNDGLEITSGELKKLQELKNTNLQAFNEYANTLMKVLGVTSKGASNLSNLQQGIQSVSEATAQSLESIINSIRYFVAQQQSDVAAIRNILEVRLGAVTAQGESGGSSNQMIALMEQQTGYLHEICDNWSSVLKGGHKQGGKGIKVFMS